MLTAAEVTAQSGEGFAAIALLGAIVVGLGYAALKAMFGRDQ
jgi:hypothetical protein